MYAEFYAGTLDLDAVYCDDCAASCLDCDLADEAEMEAAGVAEIYETKFPALTCCVCEKTFRFGEED